MFVVITHYPVLVLGTSRLYRNSEAAQVLGPVRLRDSLKFQTSNTLVYSFSIQLWVRNIDEKNVYGILRLVHENNKKYMLPPIVGFKWQTNRLRTTCSCPDHHLRQSATS